jgi:DNA-binding NarL/FixJ family response regulator
MIVDDHRIIRTGLRFSLLAFDDLKLVADAESGEEALELCRQMADSTAMPDVILMDMVMPEMNGVAATQAILSEFPDVRVLALTGFDTGTLVHGALEAGATGYILKDATLDELADAIRAAHAGRMTLAPAAVRSLAETSQQEPKGGGELTDPERQVLALIAGGLGSSQIARQLDIAPTTAMLRVMAVLFKLGAVDCTEAAALARNLGID